MNGSSAACGRVQEDGREMTQLNCCSYTTRRIVEYQMVSPFFGGQGTQHGRAGEGGKLPVEHARILKNGAATIGVCSAAEAKLAKGGGGRGNGPAWQTS